MTVAVLYCDPKGCYPQLVGPELCWDETRDARTYAGPGPVIAHPPCGPWSKQRHNYRGTEHELAIRAVDDVRHWGGVLEHPAHSKLWDALVCATWASGRMFDPLPRPGELPDSWGGYTIEVCQCDFGHPARKRTWFYLVGVPRKAITLPAPREPTHWASGGRTRSSRKGSPVPPGIKVCSAQQRRRTPVEFARWLIALAELAGKSRAA